MALAEVGDGAKIRRVEPDKAHEVDPLARRLGDPARRLDAVAIAVQQERRHHRRVKRRLPALARVSRFDLAKVEILATSAKTKRARWSSPTKSCTLGGSNSAWSIVHGRKVLFISKQNPIRAHTATKILDFSDRLLAKVFGPRSGAVGIVAPAARLKARLRRAAGWEEYLLTGFLSKRKA